MRSLFEFRVEPSLPPQLLPLKRLANNLWWSWNPRAINLFRRIDEELWETSGHNPVEMLGTISNDALERLAHDHSFVDLMNRVDQELTEYLQAETWYSTEYGAAEAPLIAYFSMEFGLTECLRLYSGGLGVLSGDHIKAASDQGLPIVGVTLLFQLGYFQQHLNPDGWQQESYPVNDFYRLPISKVKDENGEPLKITLQLPSRDLKVQIWRCEVGRVFLILLDTNLPENSFHDQDITDQLYGGDQRLRIQQEIVLGIGGIRALHAMGIDPVVCHINEGHAAFSGLERIRIAMHQHGLAFKEARVAMGGGNVFTTHTPVPAGFDVFPADLMREFFTGYAKELGIPVEELLSMGRSGPSDQHEPFNMAIMAMKSSTFTNGVSRLHGKVTRMMVAKKLKEFPLDEVPVNHVTNGIHLKSWMSQGMTELLDRFLGSAWSERSTEAEVWEGIDRISNAELWRTHERRRERLVAFARQHIRKQMLERGATRHEIDQTDELLDPEALTIGFARRFATYKRATLLLLDRQRLKRILTNKERPVQLIFAGKAHPHDEGGKSLIRELIHFARDENVKDRVVFLESYNMNVARYLVQGVDVWLNTPRRPLEASGTSGMKVVANGGLNLSVLDGWWDEAYNHEVGWAIGHGEEYTDTSYQDQVEAAALYEILEESVIPLFYMRGRDQLPGEWIRMMKASMRQLTPVFNTDRMVREYNQRFYMQAKKHYEALSANGFEPTRRLAEWKGQLLRSWGSVAIESAEMLNGDPEPFKIGADVPVKATVRLGSLKPEDVTVEMYVGRLDEYRRFREGEIVTMSLEQELGDGRYLFIGQYHCNMVGHRGIGVRVIPFHPDFATKHEMGMILWAQSEG
jgi:starch phosphorylase